MIMIMYMYLMIFMYLYVALQKHMIGRFYESNAYSSTVNLRQIDKLFLASSGTNILAKPNTMRNLVIIYIFTLYC